MTHRQTPQDSLQYTAGAGLHLKYPQQDRLTRQPHIEALKYRTRRAVLRPMRSLIQPPPAAPTAAPTTAAETMMPCSQLSLQAGKALETLMRLLRKTKQGERIASGQLMRREKT